MSIENYHPTENEIVYSTDPTIQQALRERNGIDEILGSFSTINCKPKIEKLSVVDLQKAILLVCQSLYTDVPKANIDSSISKQLLQNGIVLDKKCYAIRDLPALLPYVISQYGYDMKQLNQTFHASFQNVIEKTDAELVEEQLMHYLNAYETGIVFKPSELKELPNQDDFENYDMEVNFKYIKAVNKEELTELIKNVVTSGMALSKEMLTALKHIIVTLDIKFDFDSIKNKELQVQLYDYYNIVPKTTDKFIRYAIYKLLGTSLMIKDRGTLIGLKYAMPYDKETLLLRFFNSTTEEEIAKTFFRYKKFFLMMKTSKTANIINRIRRKADKLHVPAKKKVLDMLTSGDEINIQEVKKELEKVTLYKKFAILNALNGYLHSTDERLYHIRNGSVWMKKVKDISNERKIILSLLYDYIYNDVVKEIEPLVKGKVIYIPSNLRIAVPTSEKMFFGNVPFGTKIDLGKKNSVLAIHWIGDHIDLDLHCTSENYHIGWNSSYHFSDDVIFSGDLVTAPKPNGATEAVYIDNAVENEIFAFNVNVFSGGKEQEFSVILDTMEKPSNNTDFRKYIIDNRSMLTHTNVKTKDLDNIIGLLNVEDGERAFYFMNFSTGSSRIPMNESNRVILNNVKWQVCLNDVLKDAGAKIVDEHIYYDAEEIKIDTNLSLEMMDKTTLLSLFSK